MIGRTLQHYQIVAKLGQGGMGAVYKAHDVRLDRFVALKVLQSDSEISADSKKRFLREAQAASALTHPNIVTIHDIATADGVDFIVMEYVPGRTLREAAGRKGIPLAEALRYAVQTADALARAHGAGIVHRDLKPSNIMITEAGQVKLLDFGIAKLAQRDSDSDETRTLAADATRLTRQGEVIGTLAYMSPEQLEGRNVDWRSDIFSFGVVLFEMLTGERAFPGVSTAATISAILRDQPSLDQATTSRLPPELHRILSRCLRKDPARRFQHAGDVKIALEEVLEETTSEGAAGSSGIRAPAPAHPRRGWWILAACAALGLAAAALLTLLSTGGSRQSWKLRRLTSDLDFAIEPAASPDGKLVVYSADPEGQGKLSLWVRQLTGGPHVRVTNSAADDHDPAFSPDGSKIAFRSETGNGGIYVVPALGGDPLKITDEGQRPRFSPDGRWISYWARDRNNSWGKTYIVPTGGGAPRQVAVNFVDTHHPIWAPDSRRILFCGTPADTPVERDQHDWWIISIEDGSRAATGAFDVFRKFDLAPDRSVPGDWVEDRVIFSAENNFNANLWQLRLAGNHVTGTPERLTLGSARLVDPFFVAGNRAVFTALTRLRGVWMIPADGNLGKVTGSPRVLTAGAAYAGYPSVSADGRSLVYAATRESSSDDIFLIHFPGPPRALVNTPAREFYPVISRDGRTVAYRASESRRRPVYAIPAGGGRSDKLCDDCDRPTGWSPDQRWLALMTGNPKKIRLLDVAARQATDYLAETGVDYRQARFSPDGHWILFLSTRDGKTLPYVAPFRGRNPPASREWLAASDSDTSNSDTAWSPDGRVVYFLVFRSGKYVLEARRFDPAGGRFTGDPFAVYSFNDARLQPDYDLGFSVAFDKIVCELQSRQSEIWVLEP